jgi:hypothetical protein
MVQPFLAADELPGGEQVLGGPGDPQQPAVGPPPGGELEARRQPGDGHGDGDRRVPGEVVRAGEAALRRVLPGPERRVLLGRLVADRGAGQDIHPVEARVDRGGEFAALS